MFTKTSLISMLLVFHSVGLNKCSNNPDTTKITVVGTAMANKHQAFVLTDDSLRYYLDGIDDWDVKYRGKRVKVTGIITDFGPPVLRNPNPEITAYPQPRLRDGILLKKTKWRLVK